MKLELLSTEQSNNVRQWLYGNIVNRLNNPLYIPIYSEAHDANPEYTAYMDIVRGCWNYFRIWCEKGRFEPISIRDFNNCFFDTAAAIPEYYAQIFAMYCNTDYNAIVGYSEIHTETQKAVESNLKLLSGVTSALSQLSTRRRNKIAKQIARSGEKAVQQ